MWFTKAATRRVKSRKALALLDVLIGMAIFALIAVIAVVAMSRFRGNAFVTGATSDATSTAQYIEGYNTENGDYPASLGTLTYASDKVTVPGVGAAFTLTK